MSAINELFDLYGRNARLYPAILVSLPLAALPGVLRSLQAVSGFAGATLFAIAVLYAAAHVVRAMGKSAEPRLIAHWGDLPTTRWLLWSDSTLDSTTKHRFIEYLRGKGLSMPSAHEERSDPVAARERLASAVTWLRNNRRGDAYRILQCESASYGFRRNLYGAKPLGLLFSVISACVGAAFCAAAFSSAPVLKTLSALHATPAEMLIGVIVPLASICGWLFVRPNWVRQSAELYARALLETCDAADPECKGAPARGGV